MFPVPGSVCEKELIVAGICGGSASGKTTVAAKIIESLDVPWVTLLSLDSFYKVICPLELMYLYFPPSFHLTVGCFCPVALGLGY